jgi:uncharacterized repeat protein (TIGR03803 family)
VEKTSYNFRGGSDGSDPLSGLVADQSGNFYGTTGGGGGGTKCEYHNQGCGTVFMLTPKGVETVLYAFSGGSDGAYPVASVLFDGAGNLLGTTEAGGTFGKGAVFAVSPGGTESVLHSFQGGSDGWQPQANLIMDDQGDLYGTTAYGGGATACGSEGCGTVFKIDAQGQESVLYAFQGESDGSTPVAGLILDTSGNLYGTALGGAAGCGVVFEVTPEDTENVLYTFQCGDDGDHPEGGLIADSAGDFYGTTAYGGSGQACEGCGTVFELQPDGNKSVIYNFQGETDGAFPIAGVVIDAAGNLYGTTVGGGGKGCKKLGGCGTVFKVTPAGDETVLHQFGRGSGVNPYAPVLLDAHGELYGTASVGGRYKDGVVFKLKK